MSKLIYLNFTGLNIFPKHISGQKSLVAIIICISSAECCKDKLQLLVEHILLCEASCRKVADYATLSTPDALYSFLKQAIQSHTSENLLIVFVPEFCYQDF